MRRLLNLTLAALVAALAAACGTPPTTGPAGAPVYAPNANLHVQGIPPIPQSLLQALAPYQDFRGHVFMDWHPTQREMLVTHRSSGSTAQLHRLRGPRDTPEALTQLNEPIQTARWEPREGRYIVVGHGSGGNEAQRLYRLDPESRVLTPFTAEGERHALLGFLNQRSLAVVSSVPLDRTAAGGTRERIDTRLWLADPLRPDWQQPVASLPGGGWFGGEVSPDDRYLAITHYRSANESEVWLIDLAGGARRRLLPEAGSDLKAAHFASGYSPDGRYLYVVSDRAGEFRELFRLELASGTLQRITGHIPWDISGGTRSRDGRWLALQANMDGSDRLRLFDAATLAEQPLPALPAGNVGAARFHPRTGELLFTLVNARGPGQLYTLNLGSGRTEQWTRPASAGRVDTGTWAEQEIVRWPSFDGRTISGLITRPPAQFGGRRPVIVSIHGGPESQAQVGFLGRWQYFVQELGVAFIQPNVRGSSGFGKTFLALDNGRLREDSVKDIGALLDWIAQQPGLDPERVLVMGGSYGGYMTLAAAVHYGPRIAGAVNIVGISNFVTFLETTESYRRDLRRVEYGDERDPAMREFLIGISPLTHAQRIAKPLFVVQGRNDPRVPWTEAEQIVARVRANGTPVWYLRAENEGHGFVRRENAEYQFLATVMFARETLLK